MSGKECQNYGDVSVVVVVVDPPSESELAFDNFVEEQLSMLSSSAVISLDQAILGWAEVLFVSDVFGVMRLRWKNVVCREAFEVDCVVFGEVTVVVS